MYLSNSITVFSVYRYISRINGLTRNEPTLPTICRNVLDVTNHTYFRKYHLIVPETSISKMILSMDPRRVI